MSRPETIASLSLTGFNGARIGPMVNSVSEPVGRHLFMTVPPGWNTVMKRCAVVGVAAAEAGSVSMHSNHGRAIAMLPAPRSTARRLKRRDLITAPDCRGRETRLAE